MNIQLENGFGLLNPAPIGVIILSSSGKILACNSNAKAWLGVAIGGEAPNELIEAGDRTLHSGIQESTLLNIPGMDDLIHVVSSTLSLQDKSDGVLFRVWRSEADKTTLSKFQHDFAHALRTPLVFIHLYLDLIGRAEEDTIRERYLSTIRQQAHHLHAIIDDLIYLMSMTTSPLVLDSVSARLVAEEAISSVYTLAEKSEVILLLRGEPDLPLIRADRNAMERAIRNLLTRAIGISQTGDEVDLALVHHDRGVEVAIRDHAQAIPPQDLPLIFDPFHKEGLTLTIVKRILDKHSVEINITSKSGVGTSFTFILPAAQSPGS